jgi:predicted dienelactone hydrolase
MRPFEYILVAFLFLSLACSVLSLALSGTSARRLALLALVNLLIAGIALLLHLWLEGAHWQMMPAYLAIVPAGVLGWFAYRSVGNVAWPWEIGGLLLLVASGVCSYVVPMFRLPLPTGPYAVDTSMVYMVDGSRSEDAGPKPGGKRELMVQLWYPAEAGLGKPASYRRKQETTFQSSYQAVLLTHSRLDAPVQRAGAPFPVLIFNPAWRGRRTQDTFLTEELASHGYVVAAIDHTYNSMPVAFPDGRVVMADAVPAIENMTDTSPEEVEQIGNKETDKEALDVRFVLDELTRLSAQQGSRWYQTMDTSNAGSFGHSLGGAVSVQAWATDARIHAALNMDGSTFGTQAATAMRAVGGDADTSPLLFFYEDGYNPDSTAEVSAPPGGWTPQTLDAAVDIWDVKHVRPLIQRYGGYWLELKGANHVTFTDKPLSSPIGRLSGAGPIDTRRAQTIIRDYVVQFFDQELKHKPSALLEGQQKKYPEVVMRLHVKAGGPVEDRAVPH